MDHQKYTPIQSLFSLEDHFKKNWRFLSLINVYRPVLFLNKKLKRLPGCLAINSTKKVSQHTLGKIKLHIFILEKNKFDTNFHSRGFVMCPDPIRDFLPLQALILDRYFPVPAFRFRLRIWEPQCMYLAELPDAVLLWTKIWVLHGNLLTKTIQIPVNHLETLFTLRQIL